MGDPSGAEAQAGPPCDRARISDLARAFDLAPDATIGVYPGGSIAFANNAAEDMFAVPRGGLAGRVVEDLLPEDLRHAHAAQRTAYEVDPWRRAMGAHADLLAQRADGTSFAVEVSLAPVLTESGPLVVAAIRDVTTRRDAERRLERLSRIRMVQAAVNEAIMRARSPAELYTGVCEAIVGAGDFALACVEHLTETAVAVRAAAGPAAGWIGGSVPLEDCAPVATAIREERPVVCEVRQGEEGATACLETMRAAAVRVACWLPLRRGDEPIGALSIWSQGSDAFDEESVVLLEQLSANVSAKLERLARTAMQVEIDRIRQLVLATDDLDAIFGQVVTTLVRTLHVEACHLDTRLGGSRTPRLSAGCDCASAGSGPAHAPIRSPRAVGPSTGASPLLSREECARTAVIAQTPVRGTTTRLGEIVLKSTRRRALDGDEHDFLENVASALAAAIERAIAQAELNHLAHHDPLTGLPNRALLFDRLALATERRGGPSELALLFIDLDRFKFVNDAFGHSAGDRLLQEVALRLRAVVGSEHLVARIGGDEFAVVCDGVGAAEAEALASKIGAELAQPVGLNRGSIVPTASIGVALTRREAQVEELLREADAAMYEAKARGRNRYAFFDEKMQSKAVRWLELEADLRRALAANEFCVRYQPIYALTGPPVGAEALVRWEHPTRGVVRPDEFIPIAEETGLIVVLGDLVLDEVCAQVRAWQDVPGLCDLRLSINLSAVQLADPGLPAAVGAAVARHGVAPEKLQVEITETALMSDTARVKSALEELREIGVTVAIDDFGTGYSSLGYLRNFPVDTVKIDRCFIQDVSTNPVDLAIVRSVINLARVLGLSTVAEGVEKAEQVRALTTIGCEMGQGYYWSHSLTSDEAELVLLRSLQASADADGTSRGPSRRLPVIAATDTLATA